MKKIMIDIETFGISKEAHILSIGAVEFDDTEISNPFHVHIDPDSAAKAGLKIDVRTVMWWLTQPKAAQDSLMNGEDVELRDALIKLTNAFDWTDKQVWCKGSDFDFPIIENAYAVCGLSAPWKYYNKMDFRTLTKLVPKELYKELRVEPEIAHNALFDAYAQAETCQKILALLRFNAEDQRIQRAA